MEEVETYTQFLPNCDIFNNAFMSFLLVQFLFTNNIFSKLCFFPSCQLIAGYFKVSVKNSLYSFVYEQMIQNMNININKTYVEM